jgi:hypothetical protein
MSDALNHALALNLPRLSWRDVFEIKGDGFTDEDAAVLDAYLSKFTMRDGNLCPGCDAPLSGDMVAQLLGAATFTWGLAHGEGFCRKCRYPARAYHRDFGPVKFVSAVLPYHPEELRRSGEAQS